MTINKNRLARIGQLAVAVLAGLLTVVAVGGLAWQFKGRREISALLERYNPAEKTEQQGEDNKSNEKKNTANDIITARICLMFGMIAHFIQLWELKSYSFFYHTLQVFLQQC